MMLVRSYCLSIIALCFAGILQAQYINEFHYDNVDTDQDEFIEVVIPEPQPTDLTEYRIELYNGKDSLIYDGRSLSGIIPSCSQGLCYYVWSKQPWIQNGPREGIALVRVTTMDTTMDTTVFDFLSYEGTLVAKDGPAIGKLSVDIGISESGSPPGYSLQKRVGQSTWFAGPATRGSVNPIELLSFDGIYLEDKNGVLLQWRTATELNNQYFEVQKSTDQRLFWPVTEIAGAGNSQVIREYSYFDQDIFPERTFYRLKQVDYNGSFEYSPVITVEVHPGNTLSDMRPILRNGKVYFPRSDYRFPMNVSLFDVLGRSLFFQNQVFTGDVIPFHVSVDGIIFYHIRSHGQEKSGHLLMIDR